MPLRLPCTLYRSTAIYSTWGWGEGGHIRLKYGENMCGLASDANYATVASAKSVNPILGADSSTYSPK